MNKQMLQALFAVAAVLALPACNFCGMGKCCKSCPTTEQPAPEATPAPEAAPESKELAEQA